MKNNVSLEGSQWKLNKDRMILTEPFQTSARFTVDRASTNGERLHRAPCVNGAGSARSTTEQKNKNNALGAIPGRFFCACFQVTNFLWLCMMSSCRWWV